MIQGAALAWLGRQIRHGRLHVCFSDGTERVWGDPATGSDARITVADRRVLWSILRGGSTALTEAYMKGSLDTSDLVGFLRLAAVNQQHWAERHPRLYGFGRTLSAHFSSDRPRPVRTMAGHYNLGNDFYALWLDPTMTYSSARFEGEAATLEEGQLAKYAAIARIADLRPGQRVLEIGTGWGGFALYAAGMGCHVTTLTISDEQHLWVKERIAAAGLEDRIDARLLDFRDIDGAYDRVVSIEMIESIDDTRWPEYFETIARVLPHGGHAALQAIVIDDAFYATYVDNEDFIRRYIFPGGMLPSPGLMRRLGTEHGLVWTTSESFGRDYARTLSMWHDAFEAAWADVALMGFDEEFRCMWRTYLAYCQAGFEVGRIDVLQARFTKSPSGALLPEGQPVDEGAAH